MGVLHIAVPISGGLRSPRRPAPRLPQSGNRGTSPQPLNPPVAAVRDTLLPPSKAPEAKLQRTPEQEAEQEAVSKLVRQCIAGDPQAWQQLVVSQHRRIYAICYRFTGSACDAEDLTQDVFLRLYKNLASS